RPTHLSCNRRNSPCFVSPVSVTTFGVSSRDGTSIPRNDMSYLPPSSLYLNEPEPAPLLHPDPHPEPRRESVDETHIEPLRLAAKTPTPSAPPHMVVPPPHTVERVIEHVPSEPRHVEPHFEPHVERVVERHVERAHVPEPPPHVPHASTE